MRSILGELRRAMPMRALHIVEALAIAEEQADQLLAWQKVKAPPVPQTLIYKIPRLDVEAVSPLGVSGAVAWNADHWQMLLNADEPLVRQRFSSYHELKHVIDHPLVRFAYPETPGISSAERQESIADHFAANVLMPKRWLRKLWKRYRSVRDLAGLFDVSRAAMRYRLTNLGLLVPYARCEVGR